MKFDGKTVRREPQNLCRCPSLGPFISFYQFPSCKSSEFLRNPHRIYRMKKDNPAFIHIPSSPDGFFPKNRGTFKSHSWIGEKDSEVIFKPAFVKYRKNNWVIRRIFHQNKDLKSIRRFPTNQKGSFESASFNRNLED